MLVLSRKLSQRLIIGSDVSITIVRIDRNQVRIGISAPPGVPILRHELLDRRQDADQPPADRARPVEAKLR
ncbi:MAG TPA: carbon storage regulator [Isosphaeraceae bacterium]|nr:carbon storage regulator [Isosphaeraceae bacterium]